MTSKPADVPTIPPLAMTVSPSKDIYPSLMLKSSRMLYYVPSKISDMPNEYSNKVHPNISVVPHGYSRRLMKAREEIEAQLKEIMNWDIIASQVKPTSWLSSFTDLWKVNGSLHICLDP